MKSAIKLRIYENFRSKILSLDPSSLSVFESPSLNKMYHVYRFFNRDSLRECHIWFCVQGESIRVYGSWSPINDIPLNFFPVQSPIDIPELKLTKDEPVEGKMMFNLPLLWRELRPQGYDLKGFSVHEIECVVDSVIKNISEFVLPYFRSISKS